MDFEGQLESLREQKQELEEEIEEIEEELARKTTNTESLREDLRELVESIETGSVPESDSEEERVDGIEPVDVDPETKRPARGARSEQIRQAIDVISARKNGASFQAAELFELLKKADPSMNEDKRAYLYSKLDDLRETGVLEKVERGTWRLSD